jgi:hypothetical protein
MLTMLEIQLLMITGMFLILIVLVAYAYHRDEALQGKRLARIPVRVREDRRRVPLPEEEPTETSPTVYYIGFLLVAYLLAMLVLAA